MLARGIAVLPAGAKHRLLQTGFENWFSPPTIARVPNAVELIHGPVDLWKAVIPGIYFFVKARQQQNLQSHLQLPL